MSERPFRPAAKKTPKRPAAAKGSGPKRANPVDAYLLAFDHPLKAEVLALRAIILAVDPAVSEGIKWNSPSFRLDDDFATMNIRPNAILVVLHRGAKVKDGAGAMTVDDPAGLLEWRAKDRATASFSSMHAIQANRAAFEHVLRQWIAQIRV